MAVTLPLLSVVVGCVPRDGGFHTVRDLAGDRTGADLSWHAAEDDGRAGDRVAELLRQPLGPDQAVQVALLNSPDLQAAFEEIGIARAALVGASLPPNLEVHGDLGFVSGQDRPEIGFAATANLTRLIFLPLRRAAAAAALEAEKVRAAARSLELVYQVRSAFFDYQAAEQLLEVTRTVLEAGAASYVIAQRLHEAGNITNLDLANERAFYEEGRIAVANAEVTALDRREDLNVLLGLSGGDTSWRLAGRLADPEDEVPDPGILERRAIEQSLDLLELEQRYTAAARRANLARAEGLLPNLRAGVQAEREEGPWEVGPVVSIEVPLFDRGQRQIGVARAQMRQLRQQYTARAVRIRAAVRAARNQLTVATRRVHHYREILLPLRQEIVDETQRQYNAMQVGVFQLLDAKRGQIRIGREYVVALRDYWRARATLDQILAGRLVSVPDPDASEEAASPDPRGGH
jgi:outer membrane protein TolC